MRVSRGCAALLFALGEEEVRDAPVVEATPLT
jgi:hypothetical protein